MFHVSLACFKFRQLVAEQRLQEGDTSAATKFYNLSEVRDDSFQSNFLYFAMTLLLWLYFLHSLVSVVHTVWKIKENIIKILIGQG